MSDYLLFTVHQLWLGCHIMVIQIRILLEVKGNSGNSYIGTIAVNCDSPGKAKVVMANTE